MHCKYCSAIITLINISENWLNNTGDYKLSLALFLGLKKAFDNADHKILISNMVKYGISGPK